MIIFNFRRPLGQRPLSAQTGGDTVCRARFARVPPSPHYCTGGTSWSACLCGTARSSCCRTCSPPACCRRCVCWSRWALCREGVGFWKFPTVHLSGDQPVLLLVRRSHLWHLHGHHPSGFGPLGRSCLCLLYLCGSGPWGQWTSSTPTRHSTVSGSSASP